MGFCVSQDTDLSRNMPGKVKVSAPNLLAAKRKWEANVVKGAILSVWTLTFLFIEVIQTGWLVSYEITLDVSFYVLIFELFFFFFFFFNKKKIIQMNKTKSFVMSLFFHDYNILNRFYTMCSAL